MCPDLILRPSVVSNNHRNRWALQLRYHESLGETEYVTLCRVTDEIAFEIIKAGQADWLFGEPKEERGWTKDDFDKIEIKDLTNAELQLKIVRMAEEIGILGQNMADMYTDLDQKDVKLETFSSFE